MLKIKGRTSDGFWLKVDCGRAQGWVQSPKVDRVTDRPIYSIYDDTRVVIGGIHAGFTTNLTTLVTMRNAPSWAASSLVNLPINTPVHVRSYLRDFSWVEVEVVLGPKSLLGWVPYESTALASIAHKNHPLPRTGYKTNRNRDHPRGNAHVHMQAIANYPDSHPLGNNAGKTNEMKCVNKKIPQRTQEEALIYKRLEKKLAQRRRTRRAIHILFNWKLASAFRQWNRILH